jgi:hypothetical protein
MRNSNLELLRLLSLLNRNNDNTEQENIGTQSVDVLDTSGESILAKNQESQNVLLRFFSAYFLCISSNSSTLLYGYFRCAPESWSMRFKQERN